nr:NUDIX domain-containing protein [Sedimentibacter acidaminivorans]
MEVNVLEVKFYENVEDSLLKFAVIVARHNGKWVFCKHRQRNTYEVAGGHREENEKIIDTAKRELFEETGACEFNLNSVCVYSVIGKNRVNNSGEEMYGMLYYADIKTFEKLPESEMEKVYLSDDLTIDWTYPLIQPILIKKVEDWIFDNESE